MSITIERLSKYKPYESVFESDPENITGSEGKYELNADIVATKWAKEICADFKTRTVQLGKEYPASELEVGATITDDRLEVLLSVLKYRINEYNILKGTNQRGFVFQPFLGDYRITIDKRVFYIRIDNTPLHVLTRTTGRDGFSCEEIYNGYWTGPFHDIALRNPTAYLYDSNKEWIGRLNLRWTGNPVDSDIGIDPNIYPMTNYHSQKRFDAMGNEKMLHLFLYYIFSQNGYCWYDVLTTPYIYRGHSDTTVSGHVRLPFKGISHSWNDDIEKWLYQLFQMNNIYSETM